jgi:MYXO-CTERM domain-containing protein
LCQASQASAEVLLLLLLLLLLLRRRRRRHCFLLLLLQEGSGASVIHEHSIHTPPHCSAVLQPLPLLLGPGGPCPWLLVLWLICCPATNRSQLHMLPAPGWSWHTHQLWQHLVLHHCLCHVITVVGQAAKRHGSGLLDAAMHNNSTAGTICYQCPPQ